MDGLTKASHSMAEAMYKAQQSAAGAAGAPGATGPAGGADGAAGDAHAGGHGQDNVVDAEFVDVDESKKPN